MNAIDTNVWLYSHDSRDPRKQALASSLIAAARPLALPWQVGCEFVAASRKLAAAGFTEAHAWAALTAIQGLADVILLPARPLAGNTSSSDPLLALLLGRPFGGRLSEGRRAGPIHRGHGRRCGPSTAFPSSTHSWSTRSLARGRRRQEQHLREERNAWERTPARVWSDVPDANPIRFL